MEQKNYTRRVAQQNKSVPKYKVQAFQSESQSQQIQKPQDNKFTNKLNRFGNDLQETMRKLKNELDRQFCEYQMLQDKLLQFQQYSQQKEDENTKLVNQLRQELDECRKQEVLQKLQQIEIKKFQIFSYVPKNLIEVVEMFQSYQDNLNQLEILKSDYIKLNENSERLKESECSERLKQILKKKNQCIQLCESQLDKVEKNLEEKEQECLKGHQKNQQLYQIILCLKGQIKNLSLQLEQFKITLEEVQMKLEKSEKQRQELQNIIDNREQESQRIKQKMEEQIQADKKMQKLAQEQSQIRFQQVAEQGQSKSQEINYQIEEHEKQQNQVFQYRMNEQFQKKLIIKLKENESEIIQLRQQLETCNAQKSNLQSQFNQQAQEFNGQMENLNQQYKKIQTFEEVQFQQNQTISNLEKQLIINKQKYEAEMKEFQSNVEQNLNHNKQQIEELENQVQDKQLETIKISEDKDQKTEYYLYQNRLIREQIMVKQKELQNSKEILSKVEQQLEEREKQIIQLTKEIDQLRLHKNEQKGKF